ncbi:M24 family metallopeptidase [Aerococcaceae bacterium WGS1372]
MNNRVNKLRNIMTNEGWDAFLVTTPKNVRYLTSFTGSAGNVLITPKESFFITDFRYDEQAKEQAKGFEVIIHGGNMYAEMNEILQAEGVRSVAIEADHMNVTTYARLSELFEPMLVQTQGIIEEIREVKDEEEIELIRQAYEITDQAFEHILTFIKVGVSEIEVANELEHFLKEKGASGMSFDTIVASGVRSSMPHGVASDKLIEHGDMVTLDFGCYYNGYTSDMTRTIAVGEVNHELEKVYNIVLEAHNRVIEMTKAGMTGKEVDAIARDYITEQGFGENFGHTTGHGIGLDVHEGPAVASRNDQPLVVNNIITDEPGIYITGLGGVRIEDDLLVIEDGVESLNRSPKNLIIV